MSECKTPAKQTTKESNQVTEQAYQNIISSCGENPQREGLKGTAKRAAKAFAHMTEGYQTDIQTLINGAIYESDMSEMIIVKDIELYSLCEHHLLPFFGRAHIAYLPQGKIIGLSKIARIVDAFAKRLQIQEQLTQDIANCLMHSINAQGVGVIIEAQHMCMMMRGITKQNAQMTTSVMLGGFRQDERTRSEFLSLVR
jgi:GTP cyclohydrolase IA